MSDADLRCPNAIAKTRCELVAGHQSVHTARHREIMLHWRNDQACGRELQVTFDWAEATE